MTLVDAGSVHWSILMLVGAVLPVSTERPRDSKGGAMPSLSVAAVAALYGIRKLNSELLVAEMHVQFSALPR